ncbi:MAG: prepilin peptidase [Candidatus Diapherotrites archaeon]|nr:prepilin peptidase [Candidatus Diapherotrites archaeon]
MELLLFTITLAGLLIATYTDLRERIVSDWVSYGMIIIGLGVSAFYSVSTGDSSYAINSFLAAAATFAGSLALWKLGFWAGGDVKLFTGIAALNPVNHRAIGNLLGLQGELFSTTALPIFSLSLFIYSVYAMLPLGTLIALKKTAKDTQAIGELKKTLAKTATTSFFFALAAAGTDTIARNLGLPFWAAIAAMLCLFFFAKKTSKPISLALFATGFLLDNSVLVEAGFIFTLGTALVSIVKLLFFARTRLGEKIMVNELEEGMITAVTLVEKNGRVTEQKLSIKSILKHVKENNVEALKEMLAPSARTIVSSSQADGLTLEQINELQKLASMGLIEKEIRIKESTPFVPAILAAYIILQATGDIVLNVVF